MSDKLTISLEGLQAFEASISNFEEKLLTVVESKTTKTTIGELLIARARRTIKEGGMGLSPAWKPIKQPTIDKRWELEQKKKPANRVNKQGIVSNAPLQRTGSGLQSLNFAITPQGLTLSAIKYMGWQQTGTKPYTIYPKTKRALVVPGLGVFKFVNHPGIPARPFFVVLPEDVEEIKGIVLEAVRKA
ncbi:MAG: hypothetical protein WCK32_00860 [Chlorobiaceae bacterium]